MKIYNWRPFLERWSADWEDSAGTGARWLGSAAVAEERIEELEERLGVALPLTYRSFLAVTDGWRAAGTDIGVLGAAEGLRWYGEAGTDSDGEAGAPLESAAGAGLEPDAGARLELAVTSDAEVLLDPREVNADEEWAAYLYRGRSDEKPERYESFLELMQALFREFHRNHAHSPDFVNATTRELDADVEEARAGTLRGDDIDGRLERLVEADRCGRGRAHGLRVQIEAMLGGGPLYVEELAPLAGLEEMDSGEVAERTFRYEPSGAFGKAVATAREHARWGDTDAAWDTIADAVADWEPRGGEHIAPVGLLADPFLGPVITPERGRYILETPRGEGREEGLVESEEPDEPALDGLAWLADDGQERGSYRFLLVEDVSPEDLAVRIARKPGRPVTLSAPADEREAGGAARVGWCGGDSGWSFAFVSDGIGPGSAEGQEGAEGAEHPGSSGSPGSSEGPESFRAGLSDTALELGEIASLGTASVLVWVERGSGPQEMPGTFHFSYAEDGERLYGFTVHGGDIDEWGTLPDTLDPEDLFPGSEDLSLDPDDEYEALDAIAEEYEVSLPQFALTQGRLHTVETRPWISGS
ncbi:SMI1/KNR4 family protein [Streptomyces sp. NBC_00872]|uniref:SMI1/KNR4 family protein n=1 Tax=Streptomyces sp. NBC_00872 TaxID=2903686 RepID=UPI00386EE2B9|nr:SMI1/KNR4 family protein [Streptomyces sp. NBC_00872]